MIKETIFKVLSTLGFIFIGLLLIGTGLYYPLMEDSDLESIWSLVSLSVTVVGMVVFIIGLELGHS